MLLAACGSPAQPTPVPTPTPTPREISAAIGQATLASQSVHFMIELSGKPVPIDSAGLMLLNTMEGDLKRPDGVLALLNVTLGGAVAEIRTASLAGKQYITNPITRQWGCLAPGVAFDPVILFAPDKGIEYLLQAGYQDVSLVGIEPLDGRPHYHLRGTIAGERLQPISLNLLGAGPVAVDLWADVETLRAARIVLVDTATDPARPTTWTVSFSDYDKAVEVRAPVKC
ncbi:MAG: LppX_LprAFG lipoprotein [Chloroflexales bacterium]|nr:LppX_LprAFG lipoprotein [Chloroflexales bacterium]